MSARARRASQSPPCVVFIAAEGPSEVGELSSQQWRPEKSPREGYFQPMLRKLMGPDLRFEGQHITVLGRFDAKKKLPGHADRAAMALALASTIDDCRVVVFAHDVDKTSGVKRSAVERRRSVERIQAEIEAGFAEVVATLRESCPLSFAPFADEAEEAARMVVAADILER